MIPPTVRRPLIADAVCSRLMDSLTGGTFLAGLGLHVGASNAVLGLLAALPFVAQIVQLPTVAILLRVRDRRRLVVWAAGASRVLLLTIAVLLLAVPAWLTPSALIVLMGGAALLTVVATAAWNWWMRDLLPPDELGSFFGQRMRGSTLASLAVLLGAGVALDVFASNDRAAAGYGVLFALGGIAGLAGVVALRLTPHVDPPPSPAARESLSRVPLAVRSSPPGLLAALALTGAAITFAFPFAAVFLLRSLGYSYVTVTIMAVTSQVAYMAGLRGWAHLSDRYGDRALLGVSMSILGLCLVGWALAGWPNGPALLAWLVALHFLTGYGMGGVELATTNLMLRSAPANNVAAHLAAVSLFRAAAAGVAVLLAGVAWQAMGRGVLWSWTLPTGASWTLRGFQVLCVVALALSLASAAAVRRMTAPPGARVREVARAMRREVSQMSTIAGMRGLTHAVSYYVELMAWPFAANSRRRSSAKPKAVASLDPSDAKGDGPA